MKTYNHIYKTAILLVTLLVALGCERGLSDDVEFASFPRSGDIFTDDPVGLTDQFFVSVDPAFGADTEAFDVDDNVSFEGTSSIRIDVPSFDPTNPQDVEDGNNFVGGVFEDRGSGRDLSGFDALTFYAKASTPVENLEFGFGIFFNAASQEETTRFATQRRGVDLSTTWQKIIIPMPDPSVAIQVSGLFQFTADASVNNNNVGYTLWIDEVRFENLGTVAQPRPSILGGVDVNFPSLPDQTVAIEGFQQTFNLAVGGDVTTVISPAYFDFQSSNSDVAFVNEAGLVTVVGTGTAEITASINGVLAEGSVLVESSENLQLLSIFSDVFADVPLDSFNGFFVPNQTTLGGQVDENGNAIISYTNLNFVAIEFWGRSGRPEVQPLNVTDFNTLNIQIRADEPINAGDFVRIEFNNDIGGNEVQSGAYTIDGSELTQGEFVSFSIPFSDFTNGLSPRDALGLMFFVSDNTISSISVDNIFFTVE